MTQIQSKAESALQAVSEPLRSIATRLANTQNAIQAEYPDDAKNIQEVRAQLARITSITYAALGIKVPVTESGPAIR